MFNISRWSMEQQLLQQRSKNYDNDCAVGTTPQQKVISWSTKITFFSVPISAYILREGASVNAGRPSVIGPLKMTFE
jgi:hypothetical protein